MSYYLTDGTHLYEVLGRTRNFGLAGGSMLHVQNSRTGETREMWPMERALCRRVHPA